MEMVYAWLSLNSSNAAMEEVNCILICMFDKRANMHSHVGLPTPDGSVWATTCR